MSSVLEHVLGAYRIYGVKTLAGGKNRALTKQVPIALILMKKR